MKHQQFYALFFLLSVFELWAYVRMRVFEGKRSLKGGAVKMHQTGLEMEGNVIFI